MFSSSLAFPTASDLPNCHPRAWHEGLHGEAASKAVDLNPVVCHPADVNPSDSGWTAAPFAWRERIARVKRARNGAAKSVPIGVPTIDQALPTGGLRLGALHETASVEPAVATLFTAGILARLDGPVLWVLQRPDLFAPGLAAAGLWLDRIIFAKAGKAVLPIMEEGLRHPVLTAVVAELSGGVSLVASRRLQLAAEQTGILAILIRRSFGDPLLKQPTAAVTRWRIAAQPSLAALLHTSDMPGLGRPRWRLELTRCPSGEPPSSWLVEAGDSTGHLDLVSDNFRPIGSGSSASLRLR